MKLLDLFKTIIWAKNGDTTDFSQTNYEAGWAHLGDDTPTVQDFNYVQQMNDKKDQWLFKQLKAVMENAGIEPTEDNINALLNAILKIAKGHSTPKAINAETVDFVDETGHTHSISKASLTQLGIVQLTNALDSDSETLGLTAKAGKALKTLINALTSNLQNYIPNSKKSNSVTSTSSDTVATSYAAKTAYDKAKAADDNANTRVSKSGGEMTGGLKLKANYSVSEKKWDYSGFYAGSATLNNEALPYFQIHIGSYGGNTAGYAKSLGFDLINYKAYVMNWNSGGEYAGKKEILTELHRSDSVTSASSDTVATSKAVKSANDNANGRVSKSGDTMTGKLTVSEINLSGRKLQFGDDYIYKRNNGAPDAFVFFENTGPSDGSKGNANLSFRSASALHYGSGEYANQYNSKAPYFVEEDNSDVYSYFPFVKGRVRRNNRWGVALSLGYVTSQHIGGGFIADGFGAGVVQLIENNGKYFLWKFEHGGIFRSSGDVVTGSGVSLNGVNSRVDYLTNTVNGLKLTQNLAATGWCRLPNGLLLQWGSGGGAGKKQFPVAFRQVYQVVSSSTCGGDANYDLDLFFNNTHVWGRYQTNIHYFAIGE
ncbi:tail fiber protein [Gallibacterium anatis]|uniref:tail fiber protein n=1 Tax=Gallibacterium anatis TaxID=750 RepID=UPI000BA05730|nr:tail fiber protein [Gallibacterium anatis]WAX71639.1 tail fiber protein [Gallibacterium anatis]